MSSIHPSFLIPALATGYVLAVYLILLLVQRLTPPRHPEL